ncbi:MAG: tyrosine-type recombinase/integrase [Cellulomonas sp.]
MAWARKHVAADGTESFRGYYRDPDGRTRSAGTFTSTRAAMRAANKEQIKVGDGAWLDPVLGKITFGEFVENVWFPSRHLEATTAVAYRSNLDKHFLPAFGNRPIGKILPSTIQEWVTTAVAGGLSPRSVKKYHVMLSSIFKRAVRDRIIAFNPCEDTELPKIIARQTRTITPEEYRRILDAIPDRFKDLLVTDIQTGLRWGELIALRPRHVDFLRRTITVQETIVEVSKKHSPTGQRMIVKAYPKNDKPRVLGVRQDLLDLLAARITRLGLRRDDLLFPSTETAGGNPLSRNTFRTRVWLPAIDKAQIDFPVRPHDLRHAHASWLLAGGADLKGVMDRMGHAQIMTTQKYLHALPDADQKNLAAFDRTLNRTTQ